MIRASQLALRYAGTTPQPTLNFDSYGQRYTMVVPVDIMEAAESGDRDAVLRWLDAGNDVNDVDHEGIPLFNHIAIALSRPCIALARDLIARGADVNRRVSRISPFEGAMTCTVTDLVLAGGLREFLELLIDAGLTLSESDGHHDPLAWAFERFARVPWPQFLDIILTLLRAGAPLDSLIGDPAIARPIPRCSLPRNSSAEMVMLRFEVEDPRLDEWENWVACEMLLDDIRAAGGTWAAYRRQARKDVLRLRSLVMRGRARVRRTRRADPIVDRVFRLPNELAWHVLQFWRATDAEGEVL